MAERKEMSNTGQLQISQILLEHILFLNKKGAQLQTIVFKRKCQKHPETT